MGISIQTETLRMGSYTATSAEECIAHITGFVKPKAGKASGWCAILGNPADDSVSGSGLLCPFFKDGKCEAYEDDGVMVAWKSIELN